VELDWTTVALEILNFLVLVWILKHFLYRPVLQVIERRRADIETTLNEAREREETAQQLREQFENRLAAWQQDKLAAREELQRELQQQRSHAMDELRQTLDAEREKVEVLEQRQATEFEEQRQREALRLGARFASKLLHVLSGPELEARIVELFCEQFTHLPEAQQVALRRADTARVEVQSAFALDETQRAAITQSLNAVASRHMAVSFSQQPELIAGLRLSLGDWTLGANLRDELKAFSDQEYESG
jgi:F-type H+-transporting ATPase subunit b